MLRQLALLLLVSGADAAARAGQGSCSGRARLLGRPLGQAHKVAVGNSLVVARAATPRRPSTLSMKEDGWAVVDLANGAFAWLDRHDGIATFLFIVSVGLAAKSNLLATVGAELGIATKADISSLNSSLTAAMSAGFSSITAEMSGIKERLPELASVQRKLVRRALVEDCPKAHPVLLSSTPNAHQQTTRCRIGLVGLDASSVLPADGFWLQALRGRDLSSTLLLLNEQVESAAAPQRQVHMWQVRDAFTPAAPNSAHFENMTEAVRVTKFEAVPGAAQEWELELQWIAQEGGQDPT